MLKCIVFAICLCFVLAQDDDECEKVRTYTAKYWEGVYDFFPLSNGGKIKRLYTSNHNTTELKSSFPVGEERPVSEYYLILLKNIEVWKFQRIRSDNAITWVMGNSVRFYVIDEVTGNLTITDIGKGRQTYAFTRTDGLFAAKIRNPKAHRYALLGVADFPGPTMADFEDIPKDEMLKFYPQHTDLIEKLYNMA